MGGREKRWKHGMYALGFAGDELQRGRISIGRQ